MQLHDGSNIQRHWPHRGCDYNQRPVRNLSTPSVDHPHKVYHKIMPCQGDGEFPARKYLGGIDGYPSGGVNWRLPRAPCPASIAEANRRSGRYPPLQAPSPDAGCGAAFKVVSEVLPRSAYLRLSGPRWPGALREHVQAHRKSSARRSTPRILVPPSCRACAFAQHTDVLASLGSTCALARRHDAPRTFGEGGCPAGGWRYVFRPDPSAP